MTDISLRKAYDYFIMDRETFCQDDTIQNYKNTLRYFIQFMEKDRGVPAEEIMLGTLTKFDLKNYVVYLRNKPANEGHPFKKEVVADSRLSKRTIRNYSVDLKTFLGFMHEEGYIEDILQGFKLIRAETKAVIPLSASEVSTLDSLFNPKTASGIRNLCIVHLMLDAGLRSNEVCELRVSHVLFDNRQIFIKYGKGSKERVVPMGQVLKKYLWTWLNIYRKFSGNDYFLSCFDGTPLSDSAIKSLFARLRKKSGIARLKPHLLRHTFATCFIVGGGSVELLRILMGHSSISTTQVYMHVAAVYDFQDDVYFLDPIFFKTYTRIR